MVRGSGPGMMVPFPVRVRIGAFRGVSWCGCPTFGETVDLRVGRLTFSARRTATATRGWRHRQH